MANSERKMEVSQPFVARCGSQRLCLSNPIATWKSGRSDANPGQENPEPGAQLGATPEQVERLWDAIPFAVRYSLFAPEAVLNLKVCDKACGSGHFLIAAAPRIARRLAG